MSLWKSWIKTKTDPYLYKSCRHEDSEGVFNFVFDGKHYWNGWRFVPGDSFEGRGPFSNTWNPVTASI